MNNDLKLYNLETLQELYAVAFWKVYKIWPRHHIKMRTTKPKLIKSINRLSNKLQGE